MRIIDINITIQLEWINSDKPDKPTHNATREEIADRLAYHYSEKLNGNVSCYYDKSRRAYCIRGEGLPAHPDMQALYPNGWSMLDFIKPAKARKLVAGGD